MAEIGPPDIVLDDGGHTMQQMIASFQVLYPAMRVPGVYLVEDTHTAFWGGAHADHPDGKTIYDLAFAVCRRLQEWTGRLASFSRFGQAPEQRGPGPQVSDICRMTRSVAFHDSMIVFQRSAREEPWHQAR